MNIQQELATIKTRNARVEADKAWETSWTRKIVVAIFTYIVIVSFFLIAKLPDPFANAVVPTTAFVISTSTLPFFKKIWLRKYNRKK